MTTTETINGIEFEFEKFQDGTFEINAINCPKCGGELETTGGVFCPRCDPNGKTFLPDVEAVLSKVFDAVGGPAEVRTLFGAMMASNTMPAVAGGSQPQGNPLLKMPMITPTQQPGTAVQPAAPVKAPPTPEELAAIAAQRKHYLAQMGLDVDDGAAPVEDQLAGAIVSEDATALPPPTKHAVACEDFMLYQGRKLNTDADAGLVPLGLDDEIVADCYSVAYSDEPTLTKNCVDLHRQDFIGALLDSPEVNNVRAMTVGDPLAAEIATVAFASRLKKYMVETKPDPKKCPPSTKGGAGQGAGPRDLKSQVDCMVAAAGAARSARQAIEEYEEIRGMVSPDGGTMDPKRANELFTRIRKSPTLSKIANLAGRFRRVAASKQRNKTVHGTDDVVGVTVGGDPFNMIPSELANLVHPLLRYETLSKLAENRALVWDKQGHEPVAKGPIVVVVDESGSMRDGSRNDDGTITAKIEQAKSLALAMAWIAAKQKRFCALVSFSSSNQGTMTMLPAGKWDEAKLLDWLEHFFGGGTDMDVPMKHLPEKYWDQMMKAGAIHGKTDILMITDGQVNMPKPIEDKFQEWKKQEKVKVYTLILDDQPGDLKRVSDTLHIIKRDQFNANCEAVGAVLGI